jgi:hypothetical protein
MDFLKFANSREIQLSVNSQMSGHRTDVFLFENPSINLLVGNHRAFENKVMHLFPISCKTTFYEHFRTFNTKETRCNNACAIGAAAAPMAPKLCLPSKLPRAQHLLEH